MRRFASSLRMIVRRICLAARRNLHPADRAICRSVEPVSRVFGLDRGVPIDRYYIEDFLSRNRADIKGCVLEIGDSTYTRKFGGLGVERSQVLHAVAGNREATLIGDLGTGQGIPSNAFDCMILTQTLQFVYEMRGAVATVSQALKPGGIVIATVPGISQISRFDMDRWGEFWRFTSRSIRMLFEEQFPRDAITVETHGNVLAATAFLRGLALEELTRDELEHGDPDYELIICVRAEKPR